MIEEEVNELALLVLEELRDENGGAPSLDFSVAMFAEFGGRTAMKYYFLGEFFNRAGQFEKAFACYQSAAELNPGSYHEINLMGKCMLYLGEIVQALALFNKAKELNQQQREQTLDEISDLLEKKEAVQLATLEKFTEIITMRSVIHTNMAKCYLLKKDYESTLTEIGLALGYNNDNLRAMVCRGDALYILNRRDEARKVYERIIKVFRKMEDVEIADHEAGIMAESGLRHMRGLPVEESKYADQVIRKKIIPLERVRAIQHRFKSVPCQQRASRHV